MQEQKGRVIESHCMDSIVRALDFPHLLKLIVLAIFDELCDKLEEVPISINFLYDLVKKYRIFDVNKLL